MTELAAPPTPEKPKANATGTYYVILERDDSGFWSKGQTVAARSAEAAIRETLGDSPNGGTFVAVPARSFKPIKVTAQTTTTLKLEEAKG